MFFLCDFLASQKINILKSMVFIKFKFHTFSSFALLKVIEFHGIIFSLYILLLNIVFPRILYCI